LEPKGFNIFLSDAKTHPGPGKCSSGNFKLYIHTWSGLFEMRLCVLGEMGHF
jgi:hypothetical protein